MKKWLTGFSMCWGMFCAIPNPVRRWDEGCYRQMLLCLPFLGGMLGLIWAGIGFLLVRISAPGPIFALCMTGYSVWSCPVESGKLWALPLL